MQPGPNHFLVRPGTKDGKPGPIVPLIAVDQLPDWIQLAGVPRELDTEETVGLTNLGIIDKEDDGIYEVRLHHDKIRVILNGTEKTTCSSLPDREGGAKDTTSHPSFASIHEGPAARAQEQQPLQPEERMLSASRNNVVGTTLDATARGGKPIRPHMTQAMRDKPHPAAVQRSGSITIKDKPQAVNGNPDTVFCRHWCHHGTCKWGWGCRFQHRMPTTSDGLREVGLKDFPTWYLLMMSGGGLPNMPASPGFGLDTLFGGLSMGTPPGNATMISPSQYLPTNTNATAAAAAAAAAATHSHPNAIAPHHHHQPPAAAQHPSPMDLRLMQGRMSALLASSDAMSNRQKLRLVKEMRDILMRGSHTHAHTSHAYANLRTNASMAANVANLRRQAERQQLGRQSGRGQQRQQQQYLSDLPVATRGARVRAAAVDVGDDVDEVRPEDSASRGMRDSVDARVEGERQSPVGRGDGEDDGNGDGQAPERISAPMPEEQLVDLD